jgi:ABC-type nitrate/sulfonate/bicarbonate transport system substrate-binding protein
VWAARREVLAARPDDVAALAGALAQARAWGNANRDAVVDAALAKAPYHRALYDDYFTRLSYTLDERALRGLDHFAALLASDQRDAVASEGSHAAR